MIVIMGMKVFVIIIIMTYTLTADYTEIATITSMRVMVAVALLFTVTVYWALFRSIFCLLVSSTSSRRKSKWKGFTIMEEG